MQLYTVILENKHLISTFDEKGRKTGERTELIKQTICDLPLPTAEMYRKKDAASVQIIKQDMREFGDRGRGRDVVRSAKKAASAPATKQAPAARPTHQTNVQQAAATGNMTAAINAKE